MTSDSLKKKVDEAFSHYIRLNAAFDCGFVGCFTCDLAIHWKKSQCGHFVPRANMATRFEPLNCHPQCSICNVDLRGNIEEYEKRLDEVYGAGTANTLRQMGKMTVKLSVVDLTELLSKYKSLVEKIKKEKGL